MKLNCYTQVQVGKSGKISFGDSPRQSLFTLAGELPTGDNLTAFKAHFAKDVANTLKISGNKPEDKVQVTSVTANKASGGRRRRLSVGGNSSFTVAFTFDKSLGSYTSVMEDSAKLVTGSASDDDTKLKSILEDLTIQGFPVKTALSNQVSNPNIVGGKGMDIAAGGTVELGKGSVVGFKNVTSDGLIDIAESAVCTFASTDLNNPTTLRGDGLKTAPSSTVDVAVGIVNVEGPLRSSGKLSVGAMAQLGVTVTDGAKEESVVSGDGLTLQGGLFVSSSGSRRRSLGVNDAKKKPQLKIAGAKGVMASNTSKVKIEKGAGLLFATDNGVQNEFHGPIQLETSAELTLGEESSIVVTELASAGMMKLGAKSQATFETASRVQSDGKVLSTQTVFKGEKVRISLQQPMEWQVY